jgi:hypothetical protein
MLTFIFNLNFFLFFMPALLLTAPQTFLSNDDTVHLSSTLQEQLPFLTPTQPFINFNLGLSDADKKLLQEIKFNNQGSYYSFGNFYEIVPEVTALLKSLGNSEHVSKRTAKIIYDIVIQVLSTLNHEAAWVSVRCFTKQDTYIMPRWHTDNEAEMVYKIGLKYKLTCTLKGPGTIFCNASEELKKQFNAIRNPSFITDPVTRVKLYDLLKSSIIQTADPYQATLFLIGDHAAIHSEPNINQDRLYLGILPGTKEQIKEMFGN